MLHISVVSGDRWSHQSTGNECIVQMLGKCRQFVVGCLQWSCRYFISQVILSLQSPACCISVVNVLDWLQMRSNFVNGHTTCDVDNMIHGLLVAAFTEQQWVCSQSLKQYQRTSGAMLSVPPNCLLALIPVYPNNDELLRRHCDLLCT